MPSDDPLSGLRALHLPAETPSFWTELGFAAALGLAVALVISLLVRWLYKPRLSLRTSAAAAIEAANALPPDERRAAQAAVLRRVVKTVAGEDSARTQGDDWAATLDRVFSTDLFTGRSGRVFVDGLYGRPAGLSEDPKLDLELAGLVTKLKR